MKIKIHKIGIVHQQRKLRKIPIRLIGRARKIRNIV